jgi:hypothetical protein
MVIGTQIVDTMSPHDVIDYYTWGWDPSWDVVWMVVSTTPSSGGPQLQWNVAVELNSSGVTYHVTVTNLTAQSVGLEGRYAIMNL